MFKTVIDRLSLYQLLSCVLIIIVLLALTVYRLEGGTKGTYVVYATPTPQATSEPTQVPTETPQPTAEPQPIKITALGEFRYTYYTNNIHDCGNTKGITFSGTRAIENLTVAVDTRIIPLGSFLYLENIGFAVAQDIGSAVKGNLIDIYYEGKVEDPQEFGQVYLLMEVEN